MVEMSIKQATTYQKQSDSVRGLVDLGGAEKEFGLEGQLPNQLLCFFVFVGLPFPNRYSSIVFHLVFSCSWCMEFEGTHKNVLLHVISRLLLHQRSHSRTAPASFNEVMETVEEAGFQIVQLQSNCKFLFKPFSWPDTACCHASTSVCELGSFFFGVVVSTAAPSFQRQNFLSGQAESCIFLSTIAM